MTRRTCVALALCAVTAVFAALPAASLADGPKTGRSGCRTPVISSRSRPPPTTTGGCVRDAGNTTAEDFLAKINPKDFGDRAWRFNASGGRNGVTTLRIGDTLRGTNEAARSTRSPKVPAFGGGCLPQFTLPLGLPLRDFTTDCLPGFATLVFPGQSRDVTNLSVGTHFFQCIIHPWMRQTVVVRSA